MAAPAVSDLTDIINQYKAAFAPQQQMIDQQITANDQSGQAQIAGIDASKTKAFKGITQAANDRGGYFSGFSPDQEADYTASTYLPALADLQKTIASTRSQLLGKKAEYDSSAMTSAIDTRQKQQDSLQAWQNQQEQLAAQAAENERQRAFQANEGAATRANEVKVAGIRYADRTPNVDVAGTVNAVNKTLQSKVGRDGHVSPSTFQNARQQWVAAGGDPATFAQTFAGYINPKYQSDYIGA